MHGIALCHNVAQAFGFIYTKTDEKTERGLRDLISDPDKEKGP